MRYKGIVIYPEELSDYWLDRVADSGMNFLGIHPMGGNLQGKPIAEAIEWVQRPETQRLLERAESLGIAVEYEMHALSWLMERELFAEHPDWFRMDENGERTNDYNCCASSEEGLAHLTERAAKLASIFKTPTGRYHFWTDDVPKPKCHCPKCREISAADETMKIYNAINRGIQSVDPNGCQSYLAYDNVIDGPDTVKPDKGIYLEFAPMLRNTQRTICDPESEMNKRAVAPIRRLIELFGTKDAQVLEYWLDNSWFSDWKMPIRRFAFSPDIVAIDSAYYEKCGFETITTFGIYLGEDYYKSFGEHFDVHSYSKAVGKLSD
ncbi:MAG: DUF4838 domain-containing protein [Clostridia bacterium]|nr:DUF4838 domain-containing protein [Clostridia bacterium]